MLHRVVLSLLAVMLLVSVAAAQGTDGLTVAEKLSFVEKTVYGAEQTGPLLDRVNKLEKDIYGSDSGEAMLVKLDKIYTYIKENKGETPSLVTRLNAVEWLLTHQVTIAPSLERLANLETTLLGNTYIGSFDARLSNLENLAVPQGHVTMTSIFVPADTLIKISITSPLDSRNSRVGDIVHYRVAEDVWVDDVLVFAKGAPGIGKVTKVKPSRNFGRDAELEVDFTTITAIDGTSVPTFLGDKAKEQTRSLAKAAGASVVGMALLGPIGVVGGVFVHGEDVEIPAGTVMYIQTKEEASVYGLLN